jgi:hypothetical protein
MLTQRPYIRVRLALIADRFRTIVERTDNCHLTMRDVAALSVSGYTVEEARTKFRLVFNALKRQRKLPRDMAITLMRPRRQAERRVASRAGHE